MNRILRLLAALVASLLLCPAGAEDSGAPSLLLFSEDFQKAEPGTVPESLLVLEGGFTVQDDGADKFLELPGAPLDSFAVIFGPNAIDGIRAGARVYGTQKGRRFPAFGIGLNGVSGYRLQVVPGRRAIELARNEEVKASAKFEWKSGTWTQLELQAMKSGEKAWRIQGRGWEAGQPKPEDWTVEFVERDEELYQGRPSLSGRPYAGTPIRYDDLVVMQPAE